MRNVRELALIAIRDVFAGGIKPRDSLERLSEALSDTDRAFLMETAYGVIRHRDRLDWIIDRFLEKPSSIRGRTRANLRLGAYQIFMMRVPDWAAVNETVKLEKRHRSLVNAVLRNTIRDRESINKELEIMRSLTLDESRPLSEKAAAISTITSHPRWLVKRWCKRFGCSEALALAEADNKIPPITLRVNTLRTTRDSLLGELRREGFEAEPTEFSPEGIRLAGTRPIKEIEGFLDRAYLQDEAAQLISHMLGPKPGERVLDACAAPGGKTTHIAQLMDNKGEIIAVDIDDKRLGILKSNVSALGISIIKPVQGDINSIKGIGFFDRVLVDAPCSSIGVIRRNPDIKYRHRAVDLDRFRERQLALLVSASRHLKAGGVLVYCTCSTEPEEGEQVVLEFLKTSGNYINIKNAPLGDKFLRTYPHRHDMDGFFGATLKRQR